MSLSDIIPRKYNYFSGVDFSNNEKKYYRSPEMLNMYKNYQDSTNNAIETRPGMKLLHTFGNQIYGLFFYNVNANDLHVLVHVGTQLLRWVNYPNEEAQTIVLYEGLNPSYSRYFIFDNIFFFMDGINYLEYNGTEIKEVEGIIPITTYERTPHAVTHYDENIDSDLVYQPVNVLQAKRKNQFVSDGESKDYYLDDVNLDPTVIFLMEAKVNDNPTLYENVDFEVDREKGIVTFNVAPEKDAKVIITYSKTIQDHKQRILNSTISCEFDNRIFVSGNSDYPNAVFHSEYNEPRYFSDIAYYECGVDLSHVKALIPASNSLYVLKETNNNQSSLIILTPAVLTGVSGGETKTYPSTNGSISLGCVSTGINFRDDIVFFSKNGLEAITGSVYNEQILTHRSTYIDAKLLSELSYNEVKFTEWKNYLLCLINSKIYLADSNAMSQNDYNKVEYEWFYWELPNDINYLREYEGNLYYGNEKGELYISYEGLKTDNDAPIKSSITTYKDNCGYDGYTKTTNKKGAEIDMKIMNNKEINIYAITNNKEVLIGTYSDEKGYIVLKKKIKKFKEIQFKISSENPFGIFSLVFEAFIAGYLKK